MLDRRHPVVVGLVDSGTCPTIRPLAAARAFRADGSRVATGPATGDVIGHAAQTVGLIQRMATPVQFTVAQVFSGSPSTSPDVIAAAIDWLAGLRVDIINLSLGTINDSASMRAACERAHENGRLLVASAPARGPVVFPAGYPNVIRVCGDARCGDGDISFLDTDRLDFGACPRGAPDSAMGFRAGGASCAAARITGALVALLIDDVVPREAVARLAVGCQIRGPQTGPVRRASLTALRAG